jgi:hypothetical protein
LLIGAERIGKEIRLRQSFLLLSFLQATEEQVEQAFGGSRDRRQGGTTRERRGSNQRDAPPHALRCQLRTQRSLTPSQEIG